MATVTTSIRAQDSVGVLLERRGLDHNRSHWEHVLREVRPSDIEAALACRPGSYNLTRLAVLVSPAAEDYLEPMAQEASQLTLQRFGRTIRLYAPLYLSNYCINSCRYCGFNKENTFQRVRLSVGEAVAEADRLAAAGFRDILLVSSEDRTYITVDYLADLARQLRNRFSFIGVEIHPMTASEYARLFQAGIEGVTLYQETYDRNAYAHYHPAGPKADYDARLRCPDFIAGADMRQVGLGVLLGLTDWRVETLALAEHANHLVRRYWQSQIAFSFPRLQPACGVSPAEFPLLVSDKNLVQMILALRLCFADAGIVLSTREPADLRDRLIGLGVTRLSAGSRTSPGGYSQPDANTAQFEVGDHRSPAEMARVIGEKGFEPVWKDWDSAFLTTDTCASPERLELQEEDRVGRPIPNPRQVPA